MVAPAPTVIVGAVTVRSSRVAGAPLNVALVAFTVRSNVPPTACVETVPVEANVVAPVSVNPLLNVMSVPVSVELADVGPV